MESNHIHIFLEKILATAHCPRCKDKIRLQNITIQASTERTCFFKIHCDNCQIDSLAQAVINVEPMTNHSDLSHSPIKTPSKISEDDILRIQEIFEVEKNKTLNDFLNRS